jgi:regulatory protein|nr:regulatory protein RecX [Candidatus Krumholzibacteria bacterium]
MSPDLRVLADVRREQGTVFLTLDSGEVFELAPASVPAELPGIGESISSPLLAVIRLAAERKLAARALFSLLDRRLYPVARLREKMVAKGYSEEAVEGVIDQMQQQGLFSDRHFAEAYCRDCLRGKAVGRRYLQQKLREKKVAPEVAQSVPAEILDQETERELAVQAAQARWKRERRSPRGQDLRKAEARVTRYLLGRGFPTGVAMNAARGEKPEPDEEY